ncbi:TPA: hypothetical protein ACW72W_004030 [Aeromonas veronii]
MEEAVGEPPMIAPVVEVVENFGESARPAITQNSVTAIATAHLLNMLTKHLIFEYLNAFQKMRNSPRKYDRRAN